MKASVKSNPDAFKALFGEDPEGFLIALNSASDALSWLEEIFKTIRDEVDRPCNSIRLKQMAELGAYIAADFANVADCVHERLTNNLYRAGHVDYKLLRSRKESSSSARNAISEGGQL